MESLFPVTDTAAAAHLICAGDREPGMLLDQPGERSPSRTRHSALANCHRCSNAAYSKVRHALIWLTAKPRGDRGRRGWNMRNIRLLAVTIAAVAGVRPPAWRPKYRSASAQPKRKRRQPWGLAALVVESVRDQAVASFRRDRSAAPRPPKPTSISAQVPGSGTPGLELKVSCTVPFVSLKILI